MLAVGVVVLHLSTPLVVALVVLGAGLVVTDLWVAVRARPRIRRGGVPTLPRGGTHPLTVQADTGRSRSERLRQPMPPELACDPPEQSGGRLDAELVARHRGVHRIPPAVCRLSGPLGLASCDVDGAGWQPVTVLPDLPRARRLSAARRRDRAGEARAMGRLGIGTEFESIRDYAPDDDIRQVNWAATARAGRPMSNQYRVEEDLDLLCLIDCGRLMASPVGEATRLDVALDAFCVLAVAAEDVGDRVGVVAFAASVLRRLEPRRKGAEPAVRAVFDLEPVELESDYERALQAVGGRKRTLVVLFTDLVDAAAARTLLADVPVVARRHRLIVVSCRDPDLERARLEPPDDVRGVLRAAVAFDLLAARRRAVGHLRRMGCEVVEADPETLGPACVAAYRRVKTGRR